MSGAYSPVGEEGVMPHAEGAPQAYTYEFAAQPQKPSQLPATLVCFVAGFFFSPIMWTGFFWRRTDDPTQKAIATVMCFFAIFHIVYVAVAFLALAVVLVMLIVVGLVFAVMGCIAAAASSSKSS